MTESALSGFLQDYTDYVNPRWVRLMDVADLMHNSASFWSDALRLARRAMNV